MPMRAQVGWPAAAAAVVQGGQRRTKTLQPEQRRPLQQKEFDSDVHVVQVHAAWLPCSATNRSWRTCSAGGKDSQEDGEPHGGAPVGHTVEITAQ